LPNARRSGRARRYQFININSRNPPVILQRMLELRQNRQPGQQNAATGNGTAGNDPLYFRDGTRVVVMDNGFSIFSNDDLDFEMLDQSGYWFGRTLANHLNNHPSALSWWQEENKISGPDSNSDLCMVVCDDMIPELDASRAAELSKIRGKRKKKSLEEEEAKQRSQQEEKKSNEEEDDGNVQPEIALSTALASVPVPVEPIRVVDPSEESNQLGEDRNVETMQFVQLEEAQASETSSNNLNISFMDVTAQHQPITISTQVVEPPQQPLSLDLDVEMASDNEESSASANNSRSFSPNYSPNSNQIEKGEMNMLNRETSTTEQPQQVNNLNIQDQSSQQEDDHPMRGDTDADSEEEPPANSGTIDASQVPLPTDDDSDDSDSTDEDTEDDEEGAVGGITVTLPVNPPAPEIEAAPATGMIQDMDPAIRAILGELQVPEGVDPTFLAALPAEMRDEVIQEHLR
jgi:Ubiquitin binding region